jgi:hypothetical protein
MVLRRLPAMLKVITGEGHLWSSFTGKAEKLTFEFAVLVRRKPLKKTLISPLKKK